MSFTAGEVEWKFKKAISHLKKRETNEAISVFDEIIEHDPHDKTLLSSVYRWYGAAFESLDKFEKALESYDYELSLHKLSSNNQGYADASKRIANLALDLGNFAKAKRVAEDLVEFAVRAKNEQLVVEAKSFLVSICLDEVETDQLEEGDKTKLLATCSEKFENADLPAHLDAKFTAMSGNTRESRHKYQTIIDERIRAKQFRNLAVLYYEMAVFSEDTDLLCMIHDLTNAVIYAAQYDPKRDQTFYKLELSKRLLEYGSVHQASIQSLAALGTARELKNSQMITQAILTLARSLRALGEVRKAAYFIVLGSLLVFDKSEEEFVEFYKEMDDLMTAETVVVDPSGDPARDESVARFTVRIEHTTTVETWKMIVKGIVEQNKENEPVDMFEILFNMSGRMEDQRAVMPARRVEEPRPESSASNKTTKSNGVLPTIGHIAHHQFGKMLNRKKSKMSVQST